MMRKTVNLLFLLSCTLAIAAVNVKDYGAVGDERHIDTPAINKAIDDAVMPFPNPETTPPVTNMYLAILYLLK